MARLFHHLYRYGCSLHQRVLDHVVVTSMFSVVAPLIPWIFCKQYTYRAHVFLMHSCGAVILSLTSRTDLTRHAWLHKNIHTPSRNVDVTPHLMTPSTGTPSSLILDPSFSEHKLCGELRPQLSGALAEPRPCTGYKPKQLAEDQDYGHFTKDKQLTEHEDFSVKPLSFHQSIQRRPTIQRKASRHRPRNRT